MKLICLIFYFVLALNTAECFWDSHRVLVQSKRLQNKLQNQHNPRRQDVITRIYSEKSELVDQKKSLLDLWNDFGLKAVGIYFSIYFVTLFLVYELIDLKLLNLSKYGIDPVELLNKVIHH